jgi:hypothetical protein
VFCGVLVLLLPDNTDNDTDNLRGTLYNLDGSFSELPYIRQSAATKVPVQH